MNYLSRIVKPLTGTALLILTLCLATGQGSLDPPAGAPTPNMKTLQEIWDKVDSIETDVTSVQSTVDTIAGDPRIPIDSLPFAIGSSGSYYFTQSLNFTAASGDAITVTGRNVTIDLNGFALTSTSAVTGHGIRVPPDGFDNANVMIKNGMIRGTTTVSGLPSSPTIVAGGFETGVLSNKNGITLKDLFVTRCRDHGVRLQTDCSVRNCTASENGGTGIKMNTGALVEGCHASKNAGSGIEFESNGIVSGCSTRFNGGDGIEVGLGAAVSHCQVSSNGGDGVEFLTSFGGNPARGALSFSVISGTVVTSPNVTRTGNYPSP